MKKRELVPFDRPEMDDSMKVYQPTIVDEEVYRRGEDGSLYIVSDIEVLKKLSVHDSSALAETLASRMQLRPSSGKQNLSDDEIRSFIKSRDFQTNTELQRYSEFIQKSIAEGMNDQDIADKIAEMRASEKTEVEQPKTE